VYVVSNRAEILLVTPWRRACMGMVLGSLVCAPVSWIDDGVTPSWVGYPVLLVVAAWRLRRGRGALFVAVTALLFLIVHLPFTWASMTGAEYSPTSRAQPTSAVQWPITLFAVPLVTSAVGWTTWYKERATGSRARSRAGNLM
jgi:hypothetical protein